MDSKSIIISKVVEGLEKTETTSTGLSPKFIEHLRKGVEYFAKRYESILTALFGTNDIYSIYETFYKEHFEDREDIKDIIKDKIEAAYREAKAKQKEHAKETLEKYNKFIEESYINPENIDDIPFGINDPCVIDFGPIDGFYDDDFDPEPYYLYDVNEYIYSETGLEVDEFIEQLDSNLFDIYVLNDADGIK